MSYPVEVCFEEDLAGSRLDRGLRLRMERVSAQAGLTVTVSVAHSPWEIGKPDTLHVSVDYDLGTSAANLDNDSGWDDLARSLIPEAKSFVDEVSVTLWRARLNRLTYYVCDNDYAQWDAKEVDPPPWDNDDPLPPSTERASRLVGDLSLGSSVVGSLLCEAVQARDPISQFVCLWQALTTVLNVDSPSRVDEALRLLGEPALPRPTAKGKSETRFTRLRQLIAHPVDRGATFTEIRDAARDLSEPLAMYVLDLYEADYRQSAVDLAYR